jgi:hypothetical protein
MVVLQEVLWKDLLVVCMDSGKSDKALNLLDRAEHLHSSRNSLELLGCKVEREVIWHRLLELCLLPDKL